MKKKQQRSKIKRFVFHVPVQEIWVTEVEAESEEEAWAKLKSGEGVQTSSFSGNTPSSKTELAAVQEVDDE